MFLLYHSLSLHFVNNNKHLHVLNVYFIISHEGSLHYLLKSSEDCRLLLMYLSHSGLSLINHPKEYKLFYIHAFLFDPQGLVLHQ